MTFSPNYIFSRGETIQAVSKPRVPAEEQKHIFSGGETIIYVANGKCQTIRGTVRNATPLVA